LSRANEKIRTNLLDFHKKLGSVINQYEKGLKSMKTEVEHYNHN